MTPETSAAAVAVRVPAVGYTPLPSVGGVAAREPVRVPASDRAIAIPRAGLPHGFRRLASALGDILGLLAAAYAFPLVILAIGIPIALLVRLAMWIARAL